MPPSPRKRSNGRAEPAPPASPASLSSPSLPPRADGTPGGTAPGESPAPSPEAGGPLVFYDGSCGLCERLVTLLLEHERGAAYRFAPLQGETARRLLGPEAGRSATVVLLRGGHRFTRSGAALRILAGLGGGWRVAALLLAVPRPLRDAAYDWVAWRRRRWFGPARACLPPNGEQGGRFLP